MQAEKACSTGGVTTRSQVTAAASAAAGAAATPASAPAASTSATETARQSPASQHCPALPQASPSGSGSQCGLEDLILVPAGEKLDEAAHMQPMIFNFVQTMAEAVDSKLHLADTHAKGGFANPPGYIDISCLASPTLRAWTQLVVPIELKLFATDITSALGQIIGRFRNALQQQLSRKSMIGLGITLQSVEIFFLEESEECQTFVRRSGPLPLDFNTTGSAGVEAICRVRAADNAALGYDFPQMPLKMAFHSEQRDRFDVQVQHLIRVGTAAAHRASKVYTAALPNGCTAVIKENTSSREVDMLRLLAPSHRNIVSLEGTAVRDEATCVLLTPFVEPLTWYTQHDELIQVAHDVVSALEYLKEKGVLHRDVSPGNFGGSMDVGFYLISRLPRSPTQLQAPQISLKTPPNTPGHRWLRR